MLAYDAPVDSKNLQAQTPLNEAISYGNRDMSMFYIIDNVTSGCLFLH